MTTLAVHTLRVPVASNNTLLALTALSTKAHLHMTLITVRGSFGRKRHAVELKAHDSVGRKALTHMAESLGL